MKTPPNTETLAMLQASATILSGLLASRSSDDFITIPEGSARENLLDASMEMTEELFDGFLLVQHGREEDAQDEAQPGKLPEA